MTEPSAPQDLSFEDALVELETIVSELERGETPLDDSIARFERGVALSRRCEDRLNEAEKNVVMLLKEGSRVVERDAATGETLASTEDPGDPVQPAPSKTAGQPAQSGSDASEAGQQPLIPGLGDDDIPF